MKMNILPELLQNGKKIGEQLGYVICLVYKYLMDCEETKQYCLKSGAIEYLSFWAEKINVVDEETSSHFGMILKCFEIISRGTTENQLVRVFYK